MDIDTLRGLVTLLLIIAFTGLVFWAWSGKRKKDFEEAAGLPFADEEPRPGGPAGAREHE